MPGAKPKPVVTKKLEGTYRPDRDNPQAPTPKVCLPLPPTDLLEEELAEYSRIGNLLLQMNVCTAVDGDVIAMTARRICEVRACSVAIDVEGLSYKTEGGLIKIHPLVNARTNAMRHLQSLLAELGFTPASRNKVSAIEEDTANEWSSFQ